MTNIELFGKNYPIKDFWCGEVKGKAIPRFPGVILYIRVHNTCNGKCKFCLNERNTSNEEIDIEKLKYVIKYLDEKRILSTITITGGEPLLNPDKLNTIINAIVEVTPKIKISISTNGTNLEQITNFDNLNNIEAIHVSRHFYIDEINNQILGVNSATSETIKRVQSKLNNIIINTVAIKGYIDSVDKVKKMCEQARLLEVKRIHFVSLIDYNEYCRSNYIDINSIFKKLEKQGDLKRIDDRYRWNYCECHFYNYEKEKEKILVMTRLTHQNYCDYVEQLVYTNDNKLLTGFDGEEIIC